jgi:hypothetical protein
MSFMRDQNLRPGRAGTKPVENHAPIVAPPTCRSRERFNKKATERLSQFADNVPASSSGKPVSPWMMSNSDAKLYSPCTRRVGWDGQLDSGTLASERGWGRPGRSASNHGTFGNRRGVAEKTRCCLTVSRRLPKRSALRASSPPMPAAIVSAPDILHDSLETVFPTPSTHRHGRLTVSSSRSADRKLQSSVSV